MSKVSTTQLIDVVSKAGVSKASAVRRIERQMAEPYTPAKDHYKIIRNAIIDGHARNILKKRMEEAVGAVHDPVRLVSYPTIANHYVRWVGRKVLNWYCPPRAEYGYAGVTVSVNPELGLMINGEPHIIKLYFKEDPLKKLHVEVIGALMSCVLPRNAFERVSVLDVRRQKLHVFDPAQTKANMAMVNAELAYISDMWSLTSKAA